MNWGEQLENGAVYFALPLIVYLAAGPIFRSSHPTRMLNWQGRRWRKGVTLALLLLSAWLETSELRYHAHVIPGSLALAVYIGLSVLFVLLIRWWWQDRKKEAAAQDALVQKPHGEGRELVAPPMGAPMGALTNPRNGQPALANQIAANLARHGSGYRQVSPAEAQRLANQGVLVIAVQPHAGHGHVATVRPGGSGNNPLINNIGAHVNVVPASRAFYRNPPVRYYTPQ